MPDWLSNLFSLTREVSSKTALPVFVALLIIIFVPGPYAERLGLTTFREEYAFLLGVIVIFAGSALIVNLFWAVFQALKPMVNEKIFIFYHKSVLKSLTAAEKEVLRQFVIDGDAEVSANVASGVFNLLERKHIVSRASNVSAFHYNFRYILEPWAREYLEKNRHLLSAE